ncbi:nitroreductase [Breoghania corrubedonensis]|uniref:Nitroreductase n=1 Tax=Breoghania corrubedonensis TaxID=665038 RepID=A0A2T5V4N7_9HYPH|nr:nitroreductase [Breoghania corrubedonensis]PTW58709.1 nitroreductase [Breoghania corrubedonensis]
MTSPDNPLFSLMESRHSCRTFLEEPVPGDVVERILTTARAAPSSANLQPGRFHVLTGAPLCVFCEDLAGHVQAEPPEPLEYSYLPEPMPAHLKERQRAAGYSLYRALGIERRDIAARKAQFAANYRFFDAPVGIIVSIRRDMGAGCFMDLGMSIMALMLAAQSLGYASCGIGAFSNYGRFVHRRLGLVDEELVVCGIALGRGDGAAPVNGFRTERAPLADYAVFHGFDGER